VATASVGRSMVVLWSGKVPVSHADKGEMQIGDAEWRCRGEMQGGDAGGRCRGELSLRHAVWCIVLGFHIHR
jgi:hypothetical protein